MPKRGSIIGAEGRRVFTADPVLNLMICVYLLAVEDSKKTDIPFSTDPLSQLAVEDSKKTDIPFSTDPLSKKLITNASDWLQSETGQAVYKFILEGLTNG